MMTITIYGPLRGKARPRFPAGGGKPYTPETTRQYEGDIQGAWLLAHGEKLEGPVAVDVTAYQAMPRRATKAFRDAAARGDLWPSCKPDIDNIIKIALDALNGYAYADDKQVVRLDARKLYALDGVSRLVITVGGVEEHVHDERESEG